VVLTKTEKRETRPQATWPTWRFSPPILFPFPRRNQASRIGTYDRGWRCLCSEEFSNSRHCIASKSKLVSCQRVTEVMPSSESSGGTSHSLLVRCWRHSQMPDASALQVLGDLGLGSWVATALPFYSARAGGLEMKGFSLGLFCFSSWRLGVGVLYELFE